MSLAAISILLVSKFVGLIPPVVAGILAARKWKIPPYVWIGVFALAGFSIGRLIPQPTPARSFNFTFPAPSGYTGKADVQVTSAELVMPGTIFAAGTYNEVPEGKDIVLYLRATNNRYYIRAAQKRKGGTWEVIEKTDLGDVTKLGGTYEVGLLLAETGPGKCLELGNKEGISGLPSCAETLRHITVKRN
jgi:hypothetical protein